MPVYPQLSSAALAQFPILKRRSQRTVVNTLADFTTIKLADPAGEITEWQLTYTNLADTEAQALLQFFMAAEGSLNVFTFLDPTANLLSWSEQLTDAAWSAAPFLSLTAEIADPNGGTAAWLLANSGDAGQTLSQTLSAPGAYTYCFSVYAQAAQPLTITLVCGNTSAQCPVAQQWTRFTVTGPGDPAALSTTFGVTVPPGATVNLYGFQAEPQAAASLYKPSETGGVYENASFHNDTFLVINTGVNRNSATVNIIHANSL